MATTPSSNDMMGIKRKSIAKRTRTKQQCFVSHNGSAACSKQNAGAAPAADKHAQSKTALQTRQGERQIKQDEHPQATQANQTAVRSSTEADA